MTTKHDINSAYLNLPSGKTLISSRCVKCQRCLSALGVGTTAEIAELVRDMCVSIDAHPCTVTARDGST